MYAAIVFLPLFGAVIAGLFGRLIGARASELVTTGLLLVSAVLSVVTFAQVGLGHQETTIVPLWQWIHAGDFHTDWTIRVDTMTAVMLVALFFTTSRAARIIYPAGLFVFFVILKILSIT